MAFRLGTVGDNVALDSSSGFHISERVNPNETLRNASDGRDKELKAAARKYSLGLHDA
jgi:hypothetical protein